MNIMILLVVMVAIVAVALAVAPGLLGALQEIGDGLDVLPS